jgi:hypothetical protein
MQKKVMMMKQKKVMMMKHVRTHPVMKRVILVRTFDARGI